MSASSAPLLRIDDIDRLAPFLVSVVSESDLWMYASSRGGLTAGRVSPAGALFPYVTDDKLHVCLPHTGPLTIVRVSTPQGVVFWEPFGPALRDGEPVRRALLKSVLSDTLEYEERHEGLGLTWRARWQSSDQHGFVRTVSLESHAGRPVELEVLDGLQDLMPAGVAPALQQGASCLVNAYTRAELDAATRLGLFALQAQISDGTAPVESLKANVVVCLGLEDGPVLLSSRQVSAFRRGRPVQGEALVRGQRGAYLVSAQLKLSPGERRQWRLLADVDRDHPQVEALRRALGDPRALEAAVTRGVEANGLALERNVASADGLQCTGDAAMEAHHAANTLFNNMRGGVPEKGHLVSWRDFGVFLRERRRPLAERLATRLPSGPDVPRSTLLEWARQQGDPDVLRLAHEYFPLFFSRRHGDPSRPWNGFAIRVRGPDGGRVLDYQGNWRDIFQNWEALCQSHPAFLPSAIALFVNASTVDGFNPYRLSRAGIDWEVPEEGNPWAGIGYWGDHQVVYLTRLLESAQRHHPGLLEGLLRERWFTFADVPYRLASAADIARDPRNTITFDHQAERRTLARAEGLGGDGKLVVDASGELVRVTLLEKLLVPVLAKLANLVLEGGVWMNTQRPEWNDANNALVGAGLSVVTVCQLHRHLQVLEGLLASAGEAPQALSAATRTWMQDTTAVLERGLPALEGRVTDRQRREVLEALQQAFERYRGRAIPHGPGEPLAVAPGEVGRLLALARKHLAHTIRANRREDGLYHSYNLLSLEVAGEARVGRLQEMLEGQVAVVAAGVLSPTECAEVLEALFGSALYRADQDSFVLYPDRALPGFLAKNRIPASAEKELPLIPALLQAGDRSVVVRDVTGALRFAAALETEAALEGALRRLGEVPGLAALVAADGPRLQEVFREVFEFHRFTGRSGTMFAYEGLGSIYWHMVSKLLLAVHEAHAAACAAGAQEPVLGRLRALYFRVRGGLGFNKSAEDFGAFPSDPYSHTPAHAGAQQPGMTGLVKEELLVRRGELGVDVSGGQVRFVPTLLRRSELLAAPRDFRWVDAQGQVRHRRVEAGELAFTLCQTPIVYRLAEAPGVTVVLASGESRELPGNRLDLASSGAVLERTGAVAEVVVALPPTAFLAE